MTMTWDEYLKQSARTAPTGAYIHEDKVPEFALDAAFNGADMIAGLADRVKKGLIYGKAYAPAAPPPALPRAPIDLARADPDVIHAILGIFTEAGELLEHLHNVLTGRTGLDVVNIHEELGDLFWYIAMLYRAVGGSPDEDFTRNIEKLRVRYPDRFTSVLALNRDLVAERAVLARDPRQTDLEEFLAIPIEERDEALGKTGRD